MVVSVERATTSFCYYLNYAVSIDSAIECEGAKTCVKKPKRERAV